MFFRPQKKTRILLVDDDIDILNYMKSAFKDLPYEVYTATDAINGLQLLKDKSPFDILVTDIMMPGMNGVVFLDHVKVFYPDLRISVCSSGGNTLSGEYTADQLIEMALERGALFALRKPFKRSDFLRLIEDMLFSHITDQSI